MKVTDVFIGASAAWKKQVPFDKLRAAFAALRMRNHQN
jgi:hypothetical protein